MHSFKTWLTEEHDVSHFEGRTPHHTYQTEHGHTVHVHLEKDEHGNHAVFINKQLGGIVKTVSWHHDAEQPTKHELQHSSAYEPDEDEDDLNEEFLSFKQMIVERGGDTTGAKKTAAKAAKETVAKAKAPKEKKEAEHVLPNGNLSNNSGGVITELATLRHLTDHVHKRLGTQGSPEHTSALKAIDDEIGKVANHPNANEETKKQIQNRIYHGRTAAAGILRDVRNTHGLKARVKNAGWTSKAGDISRFTRGVHNDTQENTSDVAVEVEGSHNKPHPANSDGTHFHGFSLKSTKKKQEITAKNPGPDMDGMMDHPTRKLNADAVGRSHLEKHVWKPLGIGGKTPAERTRILDQARAEHAAAGGKDGKSPMELKANEGAKKAIRAQNDELHDHLKHLMTLPKNEGHKMIGKMLVKHLFADTDMPNSKVKVSGEEKGKIKSVVEPNSEHPLKKILQDPKTKFDVRKNEGGGALHVGYIHPQTGEFVHVGTYAAKPKSNASKVGNMGWNIKVAKMH